MDYKKQLEPVISFAEQHGTVIWTGSGTNDPKIFIPPLIVLKSNGQAEIMSTPQIPDELDTEDFEEVINILSTFVGKLKVLNDLRKQK